MFFLPSLTNAILLKKRVFTFVFLLAVLPISAVTLRAQGASADNTGTGGRHTIQGRIYFPSGRRIDSTIQVKLQSFVFPEVRVFADSNGSFSFKSLAPASYTIVVDAGPDYEVAHENVL